MQRWAQSEVVAADDDSVVEVRVEAITAMVTVLVPVMRAIHGTVHAHYVRHQIFENAPSCFLPERRRCAHDYYRSQLAACNVSDSYFHSISRHIRVSSQPALLLSP